MNPISDTLSGLRIQCVSFDLVVGPCDLDLMKAAQNRGMLFVCVLNIIPPKSGVGKDGHRRGNAVFNRWVQHVGRDVKTNVFKDTVPKIS